MAPVVNLARLVWSGTLFTNESWSCSLHFHNTGSAVPMPASAYSAAIEAWMTRVTSHISAAAQLKEVKFNKIDPTTGKYTSQTSNNHVLVSVIKGAQLSAPGQISLAVSTRTALTRGRGHAGRFYPPNGMPQAIGVADGTATASFAEAIGDSAATMIDALHAVDPMFRAVVFSKAGQSVEVITHLAVGRVWDTMRSRRRSLPELAVSASPIAP